MGKRCSVPKRVRQLVRGFVPDLVQRSIVERSLRVEDSRAARTPMSRIGLVNSLGAELNDSFLERKCGTFV
jgi:hypothetical protein